MTIKTLINYKFTSTLNPDCYQLCVIHSNRSFSSQFSAERLLLLLLFYCCCCCCFCCCCCYCCCWHCHWQWHVAIALIALMGLMAVALMGLMDVALLVLMAVHVVRVVTSNCWPSMTFSTQSFKVKILMLKKIRIRQKQPIPSLERL